MELDVGYVCGRCDTFAPFSAQRCATCGNPLGFGAAPAVAAAEPPRDSVEEIDRILEGLEVPEMEAVPTASTTADVLGLGPAPTLTEVVVEARAEPASSFVGPVRIPARLQLTEALMEQARSYSCKKCYSPVPAGHKFCGRCGEPVPREVLAAQTLLLSKMLEPGKAKLVLIKGEGYTIDPNDETAFLLGGPKHLCGRTQGDLVFDADDWVSPLHASFYYRDDARLVVRDEGSLNGVFVRVKEPAAMQSGDVFLAGEQVFRVEGPGRPTDGPADDGTFFYSSPKRPWSFRVVQVLRGGTTATQVCARDNVVTIGREGCDMNFPNDPYMSTRHCKVELGADGGFRLVDTGSKNGTYLTIRNERELLHGDYVFVGRELLRVDISG